MNIRPVLPIRLTQHGPTCCGGVRGDLEPGASARLPEDPCRVPGALVLNEFVFRFNRRRTPMAAFQSLLGLTGQHSPTTSMGCMLLSQQDR